MEALALGWVLFDICYVTMGVRFTAENVPLFDYKFLFI